MNNTMTNIQNKYKDCWDFDEVKKIYDETNVLPTKETFVAMIQNNYDRFNVIKLFEDHNYFESWLQMFLL